MLKRTGRFFDRKELTSNVSKTKVVVFRKDGGKEGKKEWKSKGEEVEEVEEFTYLGIVLQRNGDMAKNLRERTKRATIATNQVRGIGERKLKTILKLGCSCSIC